MGISGPAPRDSLFVNSRWMASSSVSPYADRRARAAETWARFQCKTLECLVVCTSQVRWGRLICRKGRDIGVEPSWGSGVADRDAPLVELLVFSFPHHPQRWGSLHLRRFRRCHPRKLWRAMPPSEVATIPPSEVAAVPPSEVATVSPSEVKPRAGSHGLALVGAGVPAAHAGPEVAAHLAGTSLR